MRRLLVTGFGPFPSMPRNPSAAQARAVAASPRWRIQGVEARCLILTTAYATLPRELDPALAEKPDAVLMIGVAGRSNRIRVEWRATNRRSTLFPDVAGERAERPQTRKPRPVLRTPLPARKALLVLRRHRMPARLSRDAGRYLCNASYFRALEAGLPVLFIHIPKTPDPDRPRRSSCPTRTARWPQRLASALTDIAIEVLREARPLVAARSRLG
jgi:pyroglutamyl-peptidase